MKPLDSNSIIQVGIVVKDVEKAAKLYSELFGIEMPVIRPAFPEITYRGQKVHTHSKLCSF
ncbi:MAG TPA: lactoylglutathione lyase, partial [Candidatus Aphodomonas merdavium]|nr:lactoylglutathione lyase [Candidatus Aphodomonas merdavium]